MSKKIRTIEGLEIGKYYTNEGTIFLRIEAGEDFKCATLVQHYPWISRIEKEHVPMIDEGCEEDYYVEISEEEFDKALDEAKERFEQLYNELKLESDEKANTKGTEMA